MVWFAQLPHAPVGNNLISYSYRDTLYLSMCIYSGLNKFISSNLDLINDNGDYDKIWAEPWTLLVRFYDSVIPTPKKTARKRSLFSFFLKSQNVILIIETCRNQWKTHNGILILCQKIYRMTTVTSSIVLKYEQ